MEAQTCGSEPLGNASARTMIRPGIMTKIGMAKGIAWAVLAVSAVGGVFDFLALAIASGGPHFEGSGLNPAQIAARTQAYHLAGVLFSVFWGAFAAAVIALGLLLWTETKGTRK